MKALKNPYDECPKLFFVDPDTLNTCYLQMFTHCKIITKTLLPFSFW